MSHSPRSKGETGWRAVANTARGGGEKGMGERRWKVVGEKVTEGREAEPCILRQGQLMFKPCELF